MFPLRRALFALAISMAVPVCAAQAATFTVPNGDVAALKSAINAANSNGENDTINLATNGSYAIVSVDNTPALGTPSDGENGLPILEADAGHRLTFNGNGATVERQAANGALGYRFFTVASGANAVWENLTLQKGFFPNNQSAIGGGAILNRGTATLRNCTVTGNVAYRGGAIFNLGALIIENSAFANNSASDSAGVISSQNAAATLTITGSSFSKNGASGSGALYITNSSATISNTAFSNNSSLGSGGAINVSGASATLNMKDSTFDSNIVGVQSGGGVFIGDATANIENCTFVKNKSYNGGGLSSSGQLTLTNSTFSENIAQGNTGQGSTGGFNGGGLEIIPSSVKSPFTVIDSCTFFGNQSDNARAFTIGGISAGSSPMTLRNSIVVGNGKNNAFDIGGSRITSGGNNLIGETNGLRFAASDQVEVTDAKLAPLANNGGLTLTHALLPDSPAIDAGNTDLATDQRGIARPQGNADDIGAYERRAIEPPPIDPPGDKPSLIVTTLEDVVADDGQNSLREAINYANYKTGADIISFADNVRGVLKLNGTQLPNITDDVTINGPGASLLAIDGDGKSGIFETRQKPFSLNGLTLRNGSQNFYGGAIYNEGNSLTVRDCVLSGNRGTAGGAIYNGGVLVIERTTFSDNTATDSSGGAIFNTGYLKASDSTFSGNVVTGDSTNQFANKGGAIFSFYNFGGRFVETYLTNCTLSGNTATRGGAIYHGTNYKGATSLLAAVTNCTITGNSAFDGAGISSESAFTVSNSIISGNSGNSDVDFVNGGGSFTSSGYNIIGTGNATFGTTGDKVGVTNPKLGPLADNGGSTQTRALLPGSPAIDAGSTNLTTDQRGFARPQGVASDIGAYEAGATAPPTESPSLVVTTTADVAANDGQTSLREAIDYANSKAGADTITFASNLSGAIALSAQLPAIADALTIQGPGAKALAVDGGGATRLLQIGSKVSVAINDLTLSGGRYLPDDGRGGAILNEGNLTMSQVAISNNTGIEGGGIANLNGVLTMTGCLLNGNVALNSGGGILNNNGQVTLINSTLSGNSATGGAANASGGGGLDSFGSAATVLLDCVTLANNSAPNVAGGNRAGLWLEEGALSIHNSVLYGNGALDLQNDGGTLTSAGYNIIGALSGSSGLAVNDRVGVNPQLGALADNGGSTLTHALLAGSPAINTGDPNIKDGFDQRGNGFPRVRGGVVDVGAFEVQSDAATPIVSLSPQNPTTNATLTATPSGFDAGAVYSYAWKKNGVVIPGETAATLDLSKPGNGDVGDIITVEVTAGSVVRTASVKVVNINRAPVAFSRNVSATADLESSFELRGSDPDGDAITFEITKAPANGQAEIKVDPLDGKTKLFYRSRARFNGVDVVRFVAVDTSGAKSNEATLGIAVKYTAPPVNRAPVAGDTNIDTYVGKSEIKGLLGRDPDGDDITFRLVNNARYGQSEIKRDEDGQFKLFYTSLNRFYGDDRVTYIAVDSRGKESNVATININFINRAPSAQNNALSVASGELVSQYLFANDPDNDALTFRLVNNPQHGTGAIARDEQGNWRVYYQSAPGYVGADRITFIAIDPQGKESQVATASINVVRVGPVPSAPAALQTRQAQSGGKS